MVVNKKLNKIFTYRNEKFKYIIDGILEDEYRHFGKTYSTNFEETFLNAKLPKDSIARSIAEGLYAEDNYWRINNSLATIFGNLASMAIWTKSYDRIPLLLEFMMDLENEISHPFNFHDELYYHLIDQFDSVVSIIEARHVEDFGKVSSDTVDYFKCVKYDLENKFAYFSLFTLLSVIKKNWEYLKNSTRTYRFLHDVCALRTEWLFNSKNRINLIRIMEQVFDYEFGNEE